MASKPFSKKALNPLAPKFDEELKKGPPHAEFIGVQPGLPEHGIEDMNLYNIYGDHPRFGSTVTAPTLQELGIPISKDKPEGYIPPTPQGAIPFNSKQASLYIYAIDAYYHGGSGSSIRQIAKDGYVMAPLETGSRNQSPLAGRAYLTKDLGYALIYALGADMVGYQGEDANYGNGESEGGIVLVAPNEDSLIPDEDWLGEQLTTGFESIWNKQTPNTIYTNLAALPILRPVFDNLKKQNKNRLWEMSYQSMIGKMAIRILQKSYPEYLKQLAKESHSLSHEGNMKVLQAWIFDKVRDNPKLKKDGSNFFDIAQEIPVTKTASLNSISKVTTKPTSEKINFRGLEIVIEWPKGSTRTFDRSDAKTEMKADYGRIDDTKGKDKEEIDVYVNRTDKDEEGQDSPYVYKVKQVKKGEDKIDEYKYMLGFRNKEQAEKIYLEHIPKDFFGGIEEMTFDDFAKFIEKNQEKNEVTAEFLPSFVNAPDNNWQFDEGGPDKEIPVDPDAQSDEETFYAPCTVGKPRNPDMWNQFMATFRKESSSTIAPSVSDYRKHNVSPMGFTELVEFQDVAPQEIQEQFDQLLDEDKLEEAYVLLEKYTHPFRMAANKKVALEEFDEKTEQNELGEEETLHDYEMGFKDLNRQNTNKPKTTWDAGPSKAPNQQEPYSPLPVTLDVVTNPANEGQNSPGGYPNRFCVKPQSEWYSNEGMVDNILVEMFKNKEAAINSLTIEITAGDVTRLTTRRGEEFRVFRNPSPDQAEKLFLSSKDGMLRIIGMGKDIYMWDAFYGNHFDVAQPLGLMGSDEWEGRAHSIAEAREMAQHAYKITTACQHKIGDIVFDPINKCSVKIVSIDNHIMKVAKL